ncbi:hypothetical protein [Streptomyces chryseus]|uniref:hypothetical protein n=1 Tax=Streptomyces chryseus TaxID=68186 RepID=UPI00110F73D8|nr:hypothetical protein [Streptomyces chryseus]
MGKWWKFGLGKDDQEPGPGPEEPTEAAPEAEAPEPAAGPGEGEKKPGLLGRLLGRGRRKAKKEKAPTPETPAAPPEAPSAPPSGPPTPAGGGEAGGGEGAGGGAGAGGEEAKRSFPSSIRATADGDWVISANEWYGHMEGTLVGNKAKEFILAYEKGDFPHCAQLVADVWDMAIASQMNMGASNIENISWD